MDEHGKPGSNILLIGFMGVGKGRTARALANHSNRFAIDTDDLIESFTKQKIRKIFEEKGESEFRHLEQLTALWLEKNVTNSVISTGGGFFMVGNIKKLGKIIYLHSSIEGIIKAINNHPNALKKIQKRPLLQDLQQARKLYEQRLPLYRQVATHEVDVEDRDISSVAKTIQKLTSKSS